MKKNLIFFLLLFITVNLFSQLQKPYIIGVSSSESVLAVQSKLVSVLENNGLNVEGLYQPAGDANRAVIVFTAPELIESVKKFGGLTGFAVCLRIGITRENNKTIVSYTNPTYWGNAYFKNNFDKVSANYSILSNKLETVMNGLGEFENKPFGSQKGLSIADIRKYHYMIGMPYFEDIVDLAKFDSYSSAVTKIDATIKKGINGVKLVSKTLIPGKELCFYSFALTGQNGESKFLPIIDITKPKHTAFLPYEILVNGNKVIMLHGRFRIALSFPDLTMMTFTKIMSTPGDIENSLVQLVK